MATYVLGRSLSKSFGAKLLFKELDFDLQSGTMTGLVGPSGSGKSTLLNIIGQLEEVDSGSVSVGGLDVLALRGSNARKYRRDVVGYLFQNYALVENDDVRSNLSVVSPSGLLKGKVADKAMDEALRVVGLDGKLNVNVAHLSGGEQQRVALARLILKQPKLVLADEPTGALDKENAAQVVSMLRHFSNNGATVLVATHNANVADACDDVLDLGAMRAS